MENNKKIVVFTGLTIPFDEAREILDAKYLPPIKRGDLYELIESESDIDIILIIDGQFHNTPAVAHKEIMLALDKGIIVFGASSMGALRASELDTLGMTGIGYVYNEYASGNVTSDDDVAVMLDSESLEPLSEPLINMNYVFKKAFSANIITESEKNELMKISKETFYPKRTYAQTLSKSSLDNDKKSELIDLIRTTPDMKKEDAKQLLEHIHLISNE